MPDNDLGQCRRRAEACRRLIDLSNDPKRKALWAERAAYWEVLEAEKQPQPAAIPSDKPPN